MNRRAVITSLIVLDETELFELVDEGHAAYQQVVVLMSEV